MMKRVQLFEFEDFNWFPSSIRNGMTRLIVILMRMIGTSKVVAGIIKSVNERHPIDQIVDLGSGSGGIMPDLHKRLKEENIELSILLTDLHPNREFVDQINSLNDSGLRFREESVDATKLGNVPGGLKTMMNSFHHMPPPAAKGILKSAFDNKQPLLVYELAENKIPLVLWWLFLPISLVVLMIMVLFMTPFVRPLNWQQLFFTYLIPVIPICYAWDGQVSMPRTYAFKDIEEMLEDLQSDNYKWEVKPAKNEKGKNSGYYILGLPA